MFFIYEEQKDGSRRGLGVGDFRARFSQICKSHLTDGRARAFAFIFYNYSDNEFRQVLDNEHVFDELNQLAGKDLSVFVLHPITEHTVSLFNSEFLAKLRIEGTVSLPCVVFFTLKDDQFDKIVVAELSHVQIETAFHELHRVMENYIRDIPPPSELKLVRLVWSGTKFIGAHALDALLGAALGRLFG